MGEALQSNSNLGHGVAHGLAAITALEARPRRLDLRGHRLRHDDRPHPIRHLHARRGLL